jgi:putative membrane protein
MQAGRRFSFWQTLAWERNYLALFLILDSIPVVMYKVLGWSWIVIPWQPVSLIGIAVAFYLGFKNNSSYERLWEGRKVWERILTASRNFTMMVRDFISDHHAEVKVPEAELEAAQKRIIYRHLAWVQALTLLLRERRPWEHYGRRDDRFRRSLGIHPQAHDWGQLRTYLSEEEFGHLANKSHKASYLLDLQARDLRKLYRNDRIEQLRHLKLVQCLGELAALQGASERLKDSPFPRQYASANFYFVWTFILLLPFAMLSAFTETTSDHFIWLSIPFSVLVSLIFFTMEIIGDYSENPFEGLYHDVPITAIARDIEIEIRETLGETDLPEPITPASKFQILY